MYEHLENASNTDGLSRMVIEPISRVEGHGKVTLLLDENRRVQQARLHIVEFRGFERFIQGRPFREVPTLVQRLCGICPISHLLAASKACDPFILGALTITPTAEKLRRLLHHAQVLQSNALHFFHLASPDLLFGFDDAVAHRNVVGVIMDQRELGLRGIRIRKYGQEVIRILTGKRVHGTGSIPGGFLKPLTLAERDEMLQGIDQIIDWCVASNELARDLFLAHQPEHLTFGATESAFLSLVTATGDCEIYDGVLRVKDACGKIIVDGFDPARYLDLIREEVKPWSYMKFPYLAPFGHEAGYYRVGPLARINNADRMPSERAEAARQEFADFGQGKPVQATLAQHWARMIDTIMCAEVIRYLLLDAEILGTELVYSDEQLKHIDPVREGVGVIEAPRGTLLHHYKIDDDENISFANLIVSTTHNNRGMNDSVRAVAAEYFDGRAVTEGLLNRIEVAIRAYDPCLSCATHALGQMPLIIEAIEADGRISSQLARHDDGRIEQFI
ncbi:Ni/Fe hydrogenase subunit alpha [Chitinibacter bivalviorum]|uniref:Ni/Fe hydrogenase subunit alpha n=1 Tax=Chitinibacter bivalviorum TaxID=2739434 RepID=A0A7H9BHU4_9NEIS|nr:Ni/Fe hydrogenase subunit alpha [Chitinibacter bivalviorum]QLG87902.1 Ni/Fe hydrogenase subunit alpha [Chitinibacter bivalviorum]